MSWTFVCFTCIINLFINYHALFLRTFRTDDIKSLQTSWWALYWCAISIFRSHLILKCQAICLVLVVLPDICCCIEYSSLLNWSKVRRIKSLRLVWDNFLLNKKSLFRLNRYIFLRKYLFIINFLIVDWLNDLHLFILITFIKEWNNFIEISFYLIIIDFWSILYLILIIFLF